MCINSNKCRFTVDRSDKYFIFTNNLYIKKKHSASISVSILNDMLAFRSFRKFRKASKCSGEVNKTQKYHQHTTGINKD